MKHSSMKSVKNSKPKKKVGKMKVACAKCDSEITNLTESRQQFRLRLRGFCESCNKFKVAYINDLKAIAESGNKFDYLVKENLPPTAQPLQQSSNPQAQKPANPSTTTPTPSAATPATPPASSNTANIDALKNAINSDTGKAFANMLKLSTDQLHSVLTTTNTAQKQSTPTTTTATVSASAAPQKTT